MESIKTAVIGSGFMGAAHIEALRRIGGSEIRAIVSDDLPRANQLSSQFNIPLVLNDWRKIMDDGDIQVIHNCTPNHLHFEINKAAILAGKHVISEKPLTMTSRESAELIAHLKNRALVHAINFNYRMYPLIQQARSMVSRGELGDIYLAQGHYLQDWLFYASDYNWRLESGLSGQSRAVADIGSHWCDLVQFITGKRIQGLFARLKTIHPLRHKPKSAIETFKGKEQGQSADFEKIPIDTEDVASVIFELDNGAQGVFTVSQVSAGRKNHFWFEIDGSRKALSWNQEEPNQLWIGYRDKANEVLIKDPALLDEQARPFAHYPGGHPEGYPDGPKNLFARVYDFIRRGNDPHHDKTDFPTFEDGHWENKIVEAILDSHRKKQWVEM